MSDKTDMHLLRLWREVTLDVVKMDNKDLTMRQMSVLLIVYMDTDDDHTVRGLAAKLNVAKPVITRALDTLSQMGLLKRKRDDRDKRNVLVQRTVAGSVYLSELSSTISSAGAAIDAA